MKEEGHNIPMIEDEPLLTDYEVLIFRASRCCKSIRDIIDYSNLFGLTDNLMFVENVTFLKEAIEDDEKLDGEND